MTDVDYGLWVTLMCHRRFTGYTKCVLCCGMLMGGCACTGTRVYGHLLYLPLNLLWTWNCFKKLSVLIIITWRCPQHHLPSLSSVLPRCRRGPGTWGKEVRRGSQQLRAVTPASFCCVVSAVYRDKAPPWKDNRESQWDTASAGSNGSDSCYQHRS